jgi:hypothetical protein
MGPHNIHLTFALWFPWGDISKGVGHHDDFHLHPLPARDSLSFHSGKPFTTHDADHDSSGGNCAVIVHGAWWYFSCYRSNLNGRYAMSEATAHKYGIDWASGRGVGHPYRRVRMMLR